MQQFWVVMFLFGTIFTVATVVVLMRRLWVGRDLVVQSPSLRPHYGRFAALELEVMGPPPALEAAISPTEVSPEPIAGPTKVEQSQHRAIDDRAASGGAAGAVADGAWPGLEYAYNWRLVDDRLFKAVSQMTHHAVNSVSDLKAATADWKGNLLADPSSAILAKVKGHLGEWLVHDHLASAGNSVTMAEHVNQPGWDLIVDKVHANVKTVADASTALHDHFGRWPDIAVILPHDAAHIPDNALHFDPLHAVDVSALDHAGGVMVDDALSHVDAAHAVERGFDAAAGRIHLHVPWITLAVVSFREAKLLEKGHTDLQRAAKNVAVTTVAVGGGGAIGTKIGGVVGTMVIPGLGTAIGALAGGIIGVMAGRSAAQGIKNMPLKSALDAYENCRKQAKETEETVIAEFEKKWDVFVGEQHARLKNERDATIVGAESAIRGIREGLVRAQKMTPGKAGLLLERVRKDLERLVMAAESEVGKRRWWIRLLWPTTESVMAERKAALLRDELAMWETERRRMQKCLEAGEDKTSEVFDLVLVAPGGKAFCRELLIRVGKDRAKAMLAAERIMGEAIGRIVQSRAQVVAALRHEQDVLKQEMQRQIDPVLAQVVLLQEKVFSEMKKAGIEVPSSS